MRKRYEAALAALPALRARPASALRDALREGYGRRDLRADLMAGAVVGVVALPLSMALAVASGVPPQHGLYTAIVGGAAVALLGGSRLQVSGPTAAFVVILAPIAARWGVGGLLVATAMAGVFLVGMGLARLGRLVQFVPYPVTTGFTAGIAVVIATLQLKDFLGLEVEGAAEGWADRVLAIGAALPTAHLPDVTVGVVTLAVLVGWPRISKAVPSPLIALAAGALLGWALSALVPGASVATIDSRFGGIPRTPPMPVLPWELAGPGGAPLGLSFEMIRALVPSAFAIAMLGAIESLLSAVVADGMTGTKHDPDAELLAQGVGNLAAPFFGGIAATGALARTATNVRSGGRSPLAAVFHAVVVLLAVLALAPVLGMLPMASLAALLLVVAWNMSEAKHFVHALRVAPKSDVFVLVTCFLLTVVFDMVVSVTAGVMLAAVLFMRRMAEVSDVRLVDRAGRSTDGDIPPNVVVYAIGGPLFFGAAHKAMSALGQVRADVRVVVLDLRGVPAIDATGLVNLESALARLRERGVAVVLGGIQPQPAEALKRADLEDAVGLAVRPSFEEALALARQQAARPSPEPAGGAPQPTA